MEGVVNTAEFYAVINVQVPVNRAHVHDQLAEVARAVWKKDLS